MIPSIRELNDVSPDNNDDLHKKIMSEREQNGPNWNHRPIQLHTYGINVGTLEIASIHGEEYVGKGWSDAYRYPTYCRVEKRHETPSWLIEMSKRFNAALRHSVGCVKDKKGYQGLPCDEAGWVNVEQILKYDHIWKDGDGEVLAHTTVPNFTIIRKRWDAYQRVIFTEYKQTRRVRAQVLALKVTKEELEKVIGAHSRFTERIGRNALRSEIGGPDREIWLWPVAIRAPMAHTKNEGGVLIEDLKNHIPTEPGCRKHLGWRIPLHRD